MAIQGETTPRPSSIFNFYFQLPSSSLCVNTTAKSYCCYGDLKGKLFDIDDHQRVATIIVPSLLQLQNKSTSKSSVSRRNTRKIAKCKRTRGMLPWDLRLGKSVNGSTLWLTTALWCLRLAGRVSVFNPTLILKKSSLFVSYERKTFHK